MPTRKINLQLFAEPGTENSGTGSAADKGDGASKAGSTDGEKDTGKTYSQADLDKIVNERTDRAANSALNSYYQQNGMTPEEAKQAVADYKAYKAAESEKNKGNIDAVTKKAEAAEKEAAKIKAEAFNDLIDERAAVAASSLGIDPARLTLLKLDFSKVGKDDTGKPKREDIKAVLEEALKVIPELKKSTEPIKNPTLPTNGGKQSTGDDDALRKAMGLAPKK